MKIDVLARARDVLKIEAQALEDVKNRLDENFVKAVEMIENCQGKVAGEKDAAKQKELVFSDAAFTKGFALKK